MKIIRTNLSNEQYVRELSAAYRLDLRIFDPDFALYQDPEFYEKLERDANVALAIQKRKHKVAGRHWTLNAGGEEPADKQLASLCEEALKCIDMFATARFNLAEAVLRGSAYARVYGEQRVTSLGGLAPMNWWVPTFIDDVDKRRIRRRSENGSVIMEVWNVHEQRWQPVPNSQWMVANIYNDRESSLGYGTGLSVALYLIHEMKMSFLREGAQAVERWSQGILTAKIEAREVVGKTLEQVQLDYLAALEKMRARNILVHDNRDEIQVHTGPGEGWEILRWSIEYCDRAETTLLLGGNLPTSATSGGSYALAEVQDDSGEDLIAYDKELLDETISRDLVGLWLKVNRPQLVLLGLGDAKKPHFSSTPDMRHDPVSSMNVIAQALDRGMAIRRDEAYKRIGFTQPQEDDDVLVGRTAPAGGPPGAASNTLLDALRSNPQAAQDLNALLQMKADQESMEHFRALVEKYPALAVLAGLARGAA